MEIQARFDGGETFSNSYQTNISEGGIFLLAKTDVFPEGQKIVMDIILTRFEVRIVLKGKIVWIRAGKSNNTEGMGVEFIDLSRNQKELLQSIMEISN
jgi:uncharacterized protein (TIGR02266 family)